MTLWTYLRSAALFAFLIAPSPIASSMTAQQLATKTNLGAKDRWFDIDAKNVWLDTGLTIAKGDLVHVYGGVLACTVLSPEKPHLPLPSAPVGVLLMKLHAEDKPVPASPDAELPAIDNASRLYLGVNGWQCSGKLPARVHIEKPQP
ncbi:MAG: hypothetical protein WBV55_14305 [Candidatus Sulfotelmatobacter sp.]